MESGCEGGARCQALVWELEDLTNKSVVLRVLEAPLTSGGSRTWFDSSELSNAPPLHSP